MKTVLPVYNHYENTIREYYESMNCRIEKAYWVLHGEVISIEYLLPNDHVRYSIIRIEKDYIIIEPKGDVI